MTSPGFAKCSRCDAIKPLTQFTPDRWVKSGRKSACTSCLTAVRIRRDHLLKNRDPAKYKASIRRVVLKRHGITQADYDSMISVVAGCAICETKVPGGGRFRNSHFMIDHDHRTGRIRGLLCHMCNSGLGSFKDDPSLLRRAIEYLAHPYNITGEMTS